MFKLRPLMQMLNRKFVQYSIFYEKLSIDEAVIKYFGHNSSKQFIGFKDYMICNFSGYCYQFDTYILRYEEQRIADYRKSVAREEGCFGASEVGR
ncbi:hypothetical protein ILUMI_18564 [Ignelater luminosus]|uniref:Transposase n=1 Tax=Ignelater luminosus TaxID=2038154 RepID=A0A8K0G6A2_IGNLU|nr:hypothetical protein ILUMI_18564 [Ignelater luminosus]